MEKYLVPKEGLIVRDPSSFTPLPEEGAFVNWNGRDGRFYRRRVSQGDCSVLSDEKLEELLEKKAKAREKALEEAEENEITETTSKRRSRK